MILAGPADGLARRKFCARAIGIAGLGAGLATGLGTVSAFAAEGTLEWVRGLGAIERNAPNGAQLGVYIYDMTNRHGFGWRAGQRFAMCSSFKLSLAALVLQRIAGGRLKAGERLRYRQADLQPNSPRASRHLADGMTLLELAEAAQIASDNTAANLLLKRIGGPGELTRFWRGLGDDMSRLDDFEPALNRVPTGEVRNTTSPRAMAQTVARLIGGGGLSASARTQLMVWMNQTETGNARLRAGLPQAWWAGDKTGTGEFTDAPGTYIDLAAVYPVKRPPFVVAAFLRTPSPQDHLDTAAEAVLAEVGALAGRWAGA